jgi:hypothetical protein
MTKVDVCPGSGTEVPDWTTDKRYPCPECKRSMSVYPVSGVIHKHNRRIRLPRPNFRVEIWDASDKWWCDCWTCDWHGPKHTDREQAVLDAKQHILAKHPYQATS